jgi:DNA-binding CsgD family transcriptional regulator
MVLPVGMTPRAATLPLLIVKGDWAEAFDLATLTHERGSPLERQMAVTILGNLARHQGDLDQAWGMVRELVPRGPGTEPEDGLFPYAIQMLRLAAELALDAADCQGATPWLHAHDRWLDWSGAVRGRSESRLLWARLHQCEGELSRADRQAQDALDLATEPRQPLAMLAACRRLGRICIDAQRYADALRWLDQALGLADMVAAPLERAAVLTDLAEVRLASEQAQQAESLLDEARTLATGLGAQPLMATVSKLEAQLGAAVETSPLTPRERDVMRLVAEGLTDAEVAERLYISPRTVGQHLQSTYNKLGVSSRAAATRIAVEQRML